MTKKDYILIASLINEVKTSRSENDFECLTIRLCEELKADNPLFNRSKFFAACGFQLTN